jgi:hypothetical protein
MLATPAQWIHLYTSICSALSAFCFIGTSPHQSYRIFSLFARWSPPCSQTRLSPEFNDFGSNRDYLVPSIINRAGELIPDVYAKPAAWVQNPMAFLPDKAQIIDIALISFMVSDLIACPVIFKLPVWGWGNDQMNRFISHQIHLSGVAMNYFVYRFYFCNILYLKSGVYVNWFLPLTLELTGRREHPAYPVK